MGKPESTELYGGVVLLEFDEDKHVYHVRIRDEDGRLGKRHKCPSVTTITGMIDDGKSGALQGWATKLMAEDIEREVKRLRYKINETTFPPLVKNARWASRRELERAAHLGNIVHSYVEDHINATLGHGDEPEKPQDPRALSGVNAFLAWEQTMRVEYVHAERRLYSVKHHYSGTVDIVAKVADKLTVLDLKTSTRVYEGYKLQVAAYAKALDEEGLGPIENRVILHLGKKGGTFNVHDLERESKYGKPGLEDDFAAFLGAREIYRRFREMD